MDVADTFLKSLDAQGVQAFAVPLTQLLQLPDRKKICCLSADDDGLVSCTS